MTIDVAAEDLARGYSIGQRDGVLELNLLNRGLFVELAMVEPVLSEILRFTSIRLLYGRDYWCTQIPMVRPPGTWQNEDVVSAPLQPLGQCKPAGDAVVPERFAIHHDDNGVYVGIVRARRQSWVKLRLTQSDKETGECLIAYDLEDMSWCIMRPNCKPNDGESSGLQVDGFREVSRIDGQIRGATAGGVQVFPNGRLVCSPETRRMLLSTLTD